MKRILLDTSAYSGWKKGHTEITATIQQAQEIFLNATVLGELRAGFAAGSRQAKNENELRWFLASPRVKVLSLNCETSQFYAAIHSSLRKAGTPIPFNDLWIAASAMQHGLAVVTSDNHFQKVGQVIVQLFT